MGDIVKAKFGNPEETGATMYKPSKKLDDTVTVTIQKMDRIRASSQTTPAPKELDKLRRTIDSFVFLRLDENVMMGMYGADKNEEFEREKYMQVSRKKIKDAFETLDANLRERTSNRIDEVLEYDSTDGRELLNSYCTNLEAMYNSLSNTLDIRPEDRDYVAQLSEFSDFCMEALFYIEEAEQACKNGILNTRIFGTIQNVDQNTARELIENLEAVENKYADAFEKGSAFERGTNLGKYKEKLSEDFGITSEPEKVPWYRKAKEALTKASTQLFN